MKKAIKLFLVLVTIGAATAAYAAVVDCPIDGMSMRFTGNTQIEMGKLLKEYKCPHGHTTWVVR